jgi:hypothetical protein
MQHELVEIEQQVHQLVEHRKALENDIKMKRAALKAAKKNLLSVRAKKR